MIKPIPKRLLPHSCIYKEYLGNTGEGDSWEEDKTLSNVKFEEKVQIRVTNNGREVVGNARLFYDLVNSSGLSKKPVINSIIIFDDKEYRVENVDVLCPDNETAHHYEILLV